MKTQIVAYCTSDNRWLPRLLREAFETLVEEVEHRIEIAVKEGKIYWEGDKSLILNEGLEVGFYQQPEFEVGEAQLGTSADGVFFFLTDYMITNHPPGEKSK